MYFIKKGKIVPSKEVTVKWLTLLAYSLTLFGSYHTEETEHTEAMPSAGRKMNPSVLTDFALSNSVTSTYETSTKK